MRLSAVKALHALSSNAEVFYHKLQRIINFLSSLLLSEIGAETQADIRLLG
jgi:hypothetical protein